MMVGQLDLGRCPDWLRIQRNPDGSMPLCAKTATRPLDIVTELLQAVLVQAPDLPGNTVARLLANSHRTHMLLSGNPSSVEVKPPSVISRVTLFFSIQPHIRNLNVLSPLQYMCHAINENLRYGLAGTGDNTGWVMC